MKTEQIITNLLFMPGRRLVILGRGEEAVRFQLGGGFGSFCELQNATLAAMWHSMTELSNGRDYMTIRHWPHCKGQSVLYRFVPVDGEWTPLDEDAVRAQLARRKLKNCEPAVMED